MYSVAVDNNKVIVGCFFGVNTGNPWAVTKLDAKAQGLQENTLEESLVPVLKYHRASAPRAKGIKKI